MPDTDGAKGTDTVVIPALSRRPRPQPAPSASDAVAVDRPRRTPWRPGTTRRPCARPTSRRPRDCSTWYESAQRGRPDADTLTVVGPVADALTEVGAAGVV
ncbi:MAG: hypothetical protein ACLTSX_00815 [Collinsella sp.]